MARLNVNPTRMQLKTLKSRLKIAQRGHKLLKDKTDEMVRRFSSFVKENYSLRKSIEEEIRNVLKQFCISKAYMSSKEVMSLFAFPCQAFTTIYGQWQRQKGEYTATRFILDRKLCLDLPNLL